MRRWTWPSLHFSPSLLLFAVVFINGNGPKDWALNRLNWTYSFSVVSLHPHFVQVPHTLINHRHSNTAMSWMDQSTEAGMGYSHRIYLPPKFNSKVLIFPSDWSHRINSCPIIYYKKIFVLDSFLSFCSILNKTLEVDIFWQRLCRSFLSPAYYVLEQLKHLRGWIYWVCKL